MQLTIFFNEKPIYLTNTLSEELILLSTQPEVFYSNNQPLATAQFLQQIKSASITSCIILGSNFTAIKKTFFDLFTPIVAAGGIVQNTNKELLFIYRRGKWDLPKGKQDDGETIETCAQREIEEETGVTQLTLKRKVGETYHIYEDAEKVYLKTSHWFYFTTDSPHTLTPQAEEQITEVKWVNTQNIKQPIANTYSSIKAILTQFFDTP